MNQRPLQSGDRDLLLRGVVFGPGCREGHARCVGATVDGVEVPGRRAFGSTMAFDVPVAGTATLHYNTPVSRTLWVVAQLIVWLALLLAASRLQPAQMVRRWRRSTGVADTSPVVDLTSPLDSFAVVSAAVPSADDANDDDIAWEDPSEELR